MALVSVTVNRTFTGGLLKGIEIQCDMMVTKERAGKVGDIFQCKNPIGGSPYRDVTIKIEQEV